MSREAIIAAAVSAAASAILLFLGALLNHLVSNAQHRREQRADKTKLRAEKFEALVAAIYEHRHWVNATRKIRAFGQPGVEVMSPMAKIEAISAVYFPELKPAIKKLSEGSHEYEMWMLEAAVRRLDGATPEQVAEGSKEARASYIRAFVSLLDELETFSKREFR